jgi:hypothetical protein
VGLRPPGICCLVVAKGFLRQPLQAMVKELGTKAKPPKHGVSARILGIKQDRIQDQLAELKLQEQDLQFERDINAIVKELLECPEKVSQCKACVLSDMFLTEGVKDMWHRTLKYLYKIPAKHIMALLERLDPRLSLSRWAILKKTDGKTAPYKIFYRSLLVCQGDLIWSHNKHEFDSMALERYKNHGDGFLEGLELPSADSDLCIDWLKHGIYQLKPEIPEGTSPKDHRFSAILDRCAGMEYTIPEHMIVTGAWVIDSNWSLRDATLSTPLKMKPKWTSKVVDLLSALEGKWEEKYHPAPMQVQGMCNFVGAGDGNDDLREQSLPTATAGAKNKKAKPSQADGLSQAPRRPALSSDDLKKKLDRLKKAL